MNMTVGQQLRQRRERRSLTLEQVSQATHLGVHYLQAIEAGNFDAIPSTAQARGFVRAYADFLSLGMQHFCWKQWTVSCHPWMYHLNLLQHRHLKNLHLKDLNRLS
jgi:hypothetical protein